MVLGAFCPGVWRLSGALRAEDTQTLGNALQELGAGVRWEDGAVVLEGRQEGPLDAQVFLGENATGMRLLLAVVPALGGRLSIDGQEGLRARPLEPSLDLLQSLGASVSAARLPVVATGSGAPCPARLQVDASTTTQVASGALIAAAIRAGSVGGAFEVLVTNPSAPAYVRVTAEVCRQFGLQVSEAVRGKDLHFTVSGSLPGGGGEVAIPVDPSARVFPLALAALHGMDGRLALPCLPGDPHPDWAVDGDLQRLAAAGEETLELRELSLRPDCLPALAVVAAVRPGFTRFLGLPALRKKESDRLAAMALGIGAAGAICAELPDGLIVGGPLVFPGGGPAALPTVPDHRVVMALSLLGTLGPVLVEHSSAVAKSWPGFFDWLGRVAVVEPG